jgi:competence protein ComEC
MSLWQPQNWSDHYSHYGINEGVTFKLKVREVLKSNAFADRYVALIKEVNGHKTSGKIILTIPIDTSNYAFKVDYELLTYGVLKDIRAPLNPHQFDYRAYLDGLGIYHELKIDKEAFYLSKHYTSSIFGMAASAREKITAKLQLSNFGKDELGIIQALLLGQRNAISAETYDNYKDAGAVHILAVSGLHIGILLLLLQFLLHPLDRVPQGKTIKLLVIVLLLWCFAFLAGLSASVVRAVTMFSFVAYALYLNRPSNTFNILALSMFFILLLFNPMLLFQVGFQMSYAAVFAIVWIYPMLQRFWNPKNSVLKKIWQLLSISIAAQLGVLPISLFYFHQFPGLFFVSNLLIVPFLGLLLGMGILVMVLALLDALPDFLVLWYDKLIGLMNSIIAWVAQQEAFIFKNISFDAIQLLLAYVILISLLILCTKPSFKKMIVFLVALIAFQSWLLYATISNAKKENLLLLHQTKNSVMFYQQGSQLTIHVTDPEVTERLVTDYMIGERINTSDYRKLKNSYLIKGKRVLILDSIGIYPALGTTTDFLVLTQSPKINLDRLLDSIRPKQIIANGSNYTSYIERWRATCAKRKLPFHYTGEKGAYYFN